MAKNGSLLVVFTPITLRLAKNGSIILAGFTPITLRLAKNGSITFVGFKTPLHSWALNASSFQAYYI